MRLFTEIRKTLSAEESVARVLYTVVDGGGGYFQNVRRLTEFSPSRIVMRGREGTLLVEGEQLSLGKYFAGDLVVRGTIKRIERGD